MSNELNLEDLVGPKAKATSGGDDVARGEFVAPTLTATITNPEGEVLGKIPLEPRAYKPNESGKGGIGWYGAVSANDGMKFGNIPVSAGFRLSVSKCKIKADDVVTMNTIRPAKQAPTKK